MARPKRGEKPLHKRSKGVDPTLARETIIHLKGTVEYYEFTNRVNEKTGIPKAAQFRIAYREWCERNGHGTPPYI